MTNSIGRIFFGGLLVLLGIGFLVDQFGPYSFGSVVGTWWPVIIIAFGALIWIKNPGRVFPGVWIIILGVLLQVSQLEILPFSVWSLWPLLLVAIGFSVLFRPNHKWENKSEAKFEHGTFLGDAVFSGVTKKISNEKFEKGDVSAVFGELKLDLRDAKIEANAVLHVDVVFGSMEVWVPRDVKVFSKVDAVAGEVNNNTNPDSNTTRTLTIDGDVVFGSLKVS